MKGKIFSFLISQLVSFKKRGCGRVTSASVSAFLAESYFCLITVLCQATLSLIKGKVSFLLSASSPDCQVRVLSKDDGSLVQAVTSAVRFSNVVAIPQAELGCGSDRTGRGLMDEIAILFLLGLDPPLARGV